MTDYQALLKQSRKDIPKPELLPSGMWRLRAQRGQFFEPRSDDQNPRATIFYKATEPLGDVDPDELAELGDYDFGNTPLEATFFLGELKDWDKLNQHFDMLGLDPEASTEDCLKACAGHEIVAYMDRDSYTDKRTGEPTIKNVPKSFQKAD